MKSFTGLFIYNLKVLLAYTVALGVIFDLGGSAMLMLIALLVHVVLLFVVSIFNFIKKDIERGKNFLLLSLVFILIGPLACFGLIFIKNLGA